MQRLSSTSLTRDPNPTADQDLPLVTKVALKDLTITQEETINLSTAKMKCLSHRSVRILLQSCLKGTIQKEPTCQPKNSPLSSKSTSRPIRTQHQSSKNVTLTKTKSSLNKSSQSASALVTMLKNRRTWNALPRLRRTLENSTLIAAAIFS